MEIGRVYVPHLAIQASPLRFASALAQEFAPFLLIAHGMGQRL